MPGIEEAIALAVEAHRGQKDKFGAPYILHPLRLMTRVDDVDAKIAAVLHDVAEDTPISIERMTALGYAPHIVAALDCLTRRKEETYEQFIERIAPNPLARRVKLADLEDNMDIRRLPAVTPKDGERLARYRAAWERLRVLEFTKPS